MKLQFFNSYEDLQQHSKQWDRVASGRAFQSWAWQGSWLEHLGNEFTPAVLVATDDSDLWIGIAPFCIDRTSSFASRLRFIGSGPACTDYVDLICDDSIYKQFALNISDWIYHHNGDETTLGTIDIVELEGVASGRENLPLLIEPFQANGFKHQTIELEGGWEVELPPTWDELNSSFSKSMRRKTKKAVSRLSAETTQLTSTNDVPIEEVWSAFRELHQRRQEMMGKEGCFSVPRFEAFLHAATERLMANDQAEIVIINSELRPLAAMLLLKDPDGVMMYQSGADPQRMKLEPGYQIAACAIQRAIENGLARFDFLRGDEPYKARWKTKRIPMAKVRLVPPNTMARIKDGVWTGVRSLKTYLQTNILQSSTSPSVSDG